jgi:hypothetical protein
MNGRNGCDESEWHGYYFIARTDTRSEQRQVKRAGSTVHANTVLRLTVSGKFLLECCYFASQCKLAAIQNAHDRSIHFILD